jgi:hypothetical protein
MTLALIVASLGALAMCLGLMRWPSVLFLAGACRNVAGAVHFIADVDPAGDGQQGTAGSVGRS